MAAQIAEIETEIVLGTSILVNDSDKFQHAGNTNVVLQPQPSRDPNEPLNWSKLRKRFNYGILSFYTMMLFASVCIQPPMWAVMAEDLNVTFTDLNNSLALQQAGIALGCIITIPVAIKFGRRPTYIVTATLVFAVDLWQLYMKTASELYATNFLAGLATSSNEVMIQVSVADLFFTHQRARALAVYGFMIILGNFLAPVASGYIAENMTWRWGYRFVSIFMGIALLLILVFYEESKYSPMITSHPPRPETSNREADATRTEEEKGKDMKTSSYTENNIDTASSTENNIESHSYIDPTIPRASYRQRFALWTTTPSTLKGFCWLVWRPFDAYFRMPIIPIVCAQVGWQLTLLATVITTQAGLFPLPPYNFSTSAVGNLNFATLIGAVIGTFYLGHVSDWSILWLTKRRGGIFEPELRIYIGVIPVIFELAGLLMYGLGISYGVNWIIPVIGNAFVGFGATALQTTTLIYVQDAFRELLGIILVALVFFRNGLATGIIFAIPAWENVNGVRNMFVGIICLTAFIDCSYIGMYIWGKQLRRACTKRYLAYVEAS